MSHARDACERVADLLNRSGCAREGLAEYVAAGRRLLVLPRPATMRPLGEVWRLGALLLDEQGALYAVGKATRAAERGRPGYQSRSREDRRDIAAAALRGGYPVGAPVNFDARALPLHETALAKLDEESPIGLHEGEVRVRWRAGATLEHAPSLAQYIRERAELLLDPLS